MKQVVKDEQKNTSLNSVLDDEDNEEVKIGSHLCAPSNLVISMAEEDSKVLTLEISSIYIMLSNS